VSKKLKEEVWVETGEFDRSYPEPNPCIRLANTKERAKHQRLYKTYGITLLEWQEMFRKQYYKCRICLTEHPRMCVDHIHIKGFKKMLPEEKKKYVRGILCFMCNTGIKGFEKTVDGSRNRQQLEGTYQYFKEFRLKGE